MALSSLDRALSSVGVEPLQSLGQPFDARYMEAVRARTVAGVADQIVLQELRCGFSWQGETLRLAQVVVNRRGARDEPEGDA